MSYLLYLAISFHSSRNFPALVKNNMIRTDQGLQPVTAIAKMYMYVFLFVLCNQLIADSLYRIINKGLLSICVLFFMGDQKPLKF